jgi:hypothetical protein
MQIRYEACQTNFNKIPSSPIAYWVSDRMLLTFETAPTLLSYCDPKQGLITGDNEYFLKYWYEVLSYNTAFKYCENKKWYPINKGGEFRKWYGNREYVLNWEHNGFEIKNFKDKAGKLRSRPQNLDFNFKEALSWSLITSSGFSVRYYDSNFAFNVAGISCFPKKALLRYLAGFLNSKVSDCITKIINPTINMNVGDIARLPVLYNVEEESCINELVDSSIALSRLDWDSFETSWDFKKHPLA